MKKHLCIPLLCLLSCLSASVKLDVSADRAVLENEWIRAEFANPGGKMTVFYDKQGKTDLTWNKPGANSTGACKDQIPPVDFSFRNSDYTFESIKNTPEECTFRVTSRNPQLKWKFQTISREYTLKAGEKILSCRLQIGNKKEEMAPVVMEYWMHSVFGVPKEDNAFQYAGPEGAVRFVPSNASNGKMIVDPVRGWIGMIGKSGRGVIAVTEYKRLRMIYPWYCKASDPLDSLEFRLIPESIPEGSSLDTTILFAAAANLPEISGAGYEGEGFLTLENGIAKGKISGFVSCTGTVKVSADGKMISEKTISLKPGEVADFSVSGVPADTKVLIAEFCRDGKKSFDLIWGKGPIPAEKRNRSALNEEPWQWTFQDNDLFPYFPWTTAGKPNVLALVPSNGVADIFELKHRRPMDVTIPVIFPQNWTLAWRISCTIPNLPDKTGCDRIKTFLKDKSYNAFLVGCNVYAPWDKKRDTWLTIPKTTRNEILARVKSGAGLMIVNPNADDPELKPILEKGRDITAELAAKMDFSAAPYFPETTIREASYGKGKIAVLKYPAMGYLAPRAGGRVISFQALTRDHRFQEYQFAILAQVLDRVCGKPSAVKSLSAAGDSAELELTQPEKVTVTLFDRYTNQISESVLELPAGKSRIPLSGLMNGENYIHVRTASGDYGYAVVRKESFPRIKRIGIDRLNGIRVKAEIGKPTEMTTAEYEVFDIDGRLIRKGTGSTFELKKEMTVSNFHKIVMTLKENGRITDRRVREFFIPENLTASSHFANLLWNTGDNLPEYIYPEHWKKLREFGFNFLYNGAAADHSYVELLRYSPLESGLNWLVSGPFMSREGMDQWEKTHDKKYLARKRCPSNPEAFDRKNTGIGGTRSMAEFGTRRIFQLGDEMSITYYNSAFDNCLCACCMKGFRAWLKERHGSLEQLNKVWRTSFKTWDDVMPMTRVEIMSHPVPAPWVEHRLFMDKVFLDAMLQAKANIRQKYPEAIVGPTGVNHPPHVYGGNWNFRNMSQLDCVSIYGPPRLQVSFDRSRRLVMAYHGYANPEGMIVYGFWEDLLIGVRSTNNWYGHIFVMPDLTLSPVRGFYSKVLWELRSGIGELLYHSEKLTDRVGILHSQNALISNYLKVKKTDYWQKELSFARAMEDLGIPYRFVAPDELGKVKFDAILLPEATALSDAEIEYLCQFVRNGGILLADYEAGTQTELCESRAARKLDELFGIRTGSFKLVSSKQKNLLGLELEKHGKGVTVTNGKADTTVDGHPILIRNHPGKGRTLLLNFAHNYAEQRGTPEGKAFLRILDGFLELPKPVAVQAGNRTIMQSTFRNGETLYAGLLPAPISGYANKTERDFRKVTFPAKLTFEKSGFLYDVRNGKYLGEGKTFDTTLSPGIGALYALLPYKPELRMTCSGTELVTVKMEIPGGKHHVFLLRVIRPDGKEELCLRKIGETLNGTLEFTVPFALNDPAGTWKLIGKDAATGQAITLHLTRK